MTQVELHSVHSPPSCVKSDGTDTRGLAIILLKPEGHDLEKFREFLYLWRVLVAPLAAAQFRDVK